MPCDPLATSSERVEKPHSCRLIVRYVAGRNDQIVNKRGRGDLLVQWILWVWHTQAAPNMRSLLVEGKNCVCIITGYAAQPTL